MTFHRVASALWLGCQMLWELKRETSYLLRISLALVNASKMCSFPNSVPDSASDHHIGTFFSLLSLLYFWLVCCLSVGVWLLPLWSWERNAYTHGFPVTSKWVSFLHWHPLIYTTITTLFRIEQSDAIPFSSSSFSLKNISQNVTVFLRLLRLFCMNVYWKHV